VNPGSPIVSSQGESGAVVWVVDENASRLASLLSDATPRPILYAVDGTSLVPLWSSANGGGSLRLGGKYETPIVAHGTVFVVTDRVQVFVLGP
jgi:outer membrane protein assembly factor BamB